VHSPGQLPDGREHIEGRAVTRLPGAAILLASVTALTAVVGSAAAQPAAPEPDANFDLGSLVDEEEPTGQDGGTPLAISGFADFTYYLPFYEPDSFWGGVGLPAYHTFWTGNLNLYFSKALSETCRALSEVRFLHEPHGNYEMGAMERTDTTIMDHAAVRRTLQLGGIRIERIWAECELTAWLTLRAGQWLTPYGIWNRDHGSPTIIAIRRPYAVGNELLPEQQTGLEAYGSVTRKDLRLGYHLTLSNGRGQVSAYEDLDANKAIGGRLELGYGRFGDLTVGASYYRGRYTAAKAPVLDVGTGRGIIDIKEQYDEQSFAFDLRWDFRNLALRSEFMHNERRYTSSGRAAENGLLIPDGFRRGGYLLAGYRTPWFGIMPYGFVQYFEFLKEPGAIVNHLTGYHFGLNILLSPAMVLKLEYVKPTYSAMPLPGLTNFSVLEAQISWAF
jgi:hypothetical protein